MSSASDFFGRSSSIGGGASYWPPMKMTTPAIVVGGDFINFSNVKTTQPTSILNSWDMTTRVLNWSVGRNDISGLSNILAIALDSIANIAYVAYTGSTQNNTLSIAAIDMTNGNITWPSGVNAGIAVTGIDSTIGLRHGRVDNANGRIHWLGRGVDRWRENTPLYQHRSAGRYTTRTGTGLRRCRPIPL